MKSHNINLNNKMNNNLNKVHKIISKKMNKIKNLQMFLLNKFLKLKINNNLRKLSRKEIKNKIIIKKMYNMQKRVKEKHLCKIVDRFIFIFNVM